MATDNPIKKARKEESKAAKNPKVKEHLDRIITARFLVEIHLIEREGRCFSRAKLEDDLYMSKTYITLMRSGKRKVDASYISQLKEKYNGDETFILHGFRKPDISGPIKAGVDLRRNGRPYTYKYRTPPVEWMVNLMKFVDAETPLDELLGPTRQLEPEQRDASTGEGAEPEA